jgi:hypothetical protein
VLVALTIALSSACSSDDSQLQQHQEKLESLTATTTAIANAWLSGSVSPTYGQTALEQTLVLVEQERTAVASDPGMLANPRGARFAESADHLSRTLAAMIHDVGAGDTSAARQHAAAAAGSAAQK